MSKPLFDFDLAYFMLIDGVLMHIHDGPDAYMIVVDNVENATLLADELQEATPAKFGTAFDPGEPDGGDCDPVDDFETQMTASRKTGGKGVAIFKGEIENGELQFTAVPYSEFPFGENQSSDDPADT